MTLPNGEGDSSSPHPTPLGACDASISAPSALDLTPQTEILDPPLSDSGHQ